MLFLNFYSVIFVVFPVREFGKLFKWSLLYWILNILVLHFTDYIILQVFIFAYILLLCYLYSRRNLKYIIYALGAYVLNIVVQYICYLYKIRFIDFAVLNRATRLLLSIDFFIIIGIVIMIKEIYIKRKEKLI